MPLANASLAMKSGSSWHDNLPSGLNLSLALMVVTSWGLPAAWTRKVWEFSKPIASMLAEGGIAMDNEQLVSSLHVMLKCCQSR